MRGECPGLTFEGSGFSVDPETGRSSGKPVLRTRLSRAVAPVTIPAGQPDFSCFSNAWLGKPSGVTPKDF